MSPKVLEHLDNGAKVLESVDLCRETKQTSSLKYDMAKSNEYSVIEFEQDFKTRKLLDFEKENLINNDCLTVDDSAVDLDEDIIAEPGYESLQDIKQRVETEGFSSTEQNNSEKGLSKISSEQLKACRSVGQNSLKNHLDDSALSLAETKVNSSTSTPLTSSSKSRDSGFESAKSQNSPEGISSVIEKVRLEAEIYDEDELLLDPGYAECADAIKGTLPFAAYSDGSGSKLSSCQSLDAPVSGIEHDYAECADALKGGSVRMRISVSNERLAANDKKSNKTKSNEHIKFSSNSELYANPQVLFKKRSRALLTDRSSGEFSNRSSEGDKNESFTFSSSESIHRDIKEKQQNKAPPLPARNYSLYLENEEVSQILRDDSESQHNMDASDHFSGNKDGLWQADDNAFEGVGCASVQEVMIRRSLDSKNTCFSPIRDSKFRDGANKTCIGQCESHSREDTMSDIDGFGYTSVKRTETKYERGTQESNISQVENRNVYYASTKEKVSVHELEKLDINHVCNSGKSENRNSFESEKMKYVKTLEDSFGYASVNNVKRQSNVFFDKAIPGRESNGLFDKTASGSEDINHDSIQPNTCYENESFENVGYSSVNECKRYSTEQPKDLKPDYKPLLTEPKLNLQLSQIDNAVNKNKLEVLAKKCTTSPVSEVVSSSFLTSPPQSANQSKDQTVPSRSYTLLEEGSFEVMVHDKAGSFRVLRITEKEEPVALTEKRKALRASLKLSSRFSDVEKQKDKKENLINASGHVEVASMEDDKEIEKLNFAVNESDSLCGVELYMDQSKTETSANDNTTHVDSIETNHNKGILSCARLVKVLPENFNKSCVGSSEAESINKDSKWVGLNDQKLPVRTDIQKVSYRSVTDSDDSDDSDMKLENLPKLVIDESVFEDSDSSESNNTCTAVENRNKTEFSEAMSVLTEQIEKELCISEDYICSGKASTEVTEIIPDFVENSEEACISSMNIKSYTDKSKAELTDTMSDIPNMIKTDNILNTCSGDARDILSNLSDSNLTFQDNLNEPIHMTLKDVMRAGQSRTNAEKSDVLKDSSRICERVDIDRKSENSKELAIDTNEIPKYILDKNKASLNSSLNGSVHFESKTKNNMEHQTGTENLHLDSKLNLRSCESNLTHKDSLAKASNNSHLSCDTARAPPRPPPPIILSPETSSDSSHVTDTNEYDTQSECCCSSVQRSQDNESFKHLPLVFRPGSDSSQSDVQNDDSPPAIPPRVRIRKHNKEASSCYRDFMESMRQLKDVGWYWGPLVWEEAEAKLANKADGSFLVRDSSDERYILSLSFKHQGRVHHTRIEHHRGQFSFWSQPESHGKSTIKDFIEQCVENSRNGRFLYFIRPSAPGAPPLPIHLLHPVSRFAQMRSLQHMCRFAILQMVRRDHIDNLPVPTRIKNYLQEAQYYVEYLED